MRRIFLFLLSACIGFSIQAQSTALSCKVLLQGAYAGNAQMGTALNTNQHLPLLQPFISGIWQYNGTESLVAIPTGMVDWVLLELRSTPDTAIARKAAVLYSDGTVKDVNGNSLMTFAVPAGNYYVAVLHRNHLTAMSAQQLSLPASGPVDFTDTSFAGYGHCQIRLAGDVMGLIGGDINQDRVLKYSGAGNDRSIILQRILSEVGGTAINATATGYFVEDLRMDGVVKYTGAQNDPSLIIQNIIALTATTAINAVFSGPVPHAVYAPYSCFPPPDPAFAGPDSLNIPDTSISLKAKQPVNGTGTWSVFSGIGGSFADSSVHNTLFTGQYGTLYTLVWTVSNLCGSNSDTVNISFICLPLPDQANAGPDVLNIADSIVQLQANQPVNGSGLWTVISGQGGSFADSTNPATNFTGLPDELYALVWTISTLCGSSSDTVSIGFSCFLQPDQAHAGPYSTPCQYTVELLDDYGDGWNGGLLSVMVNGVTVLQNITLNSGYGPASYSFTVNTGDVITTTYSPGSWSYENYYHVKNAAGVIVFSSGLSGAVPQSGQVAAATCPGAFYPDVTGDSIQLEGNIPVTGQGSWSIIAGTGGSFSDSTSATSIFYGQSAEVYTLVWTISTICGSSSDTVNITFLCFPQPDQANAGPDSLEIVGDSVQLYANAPSVGSGQWSVVSGSGAMFSDSTIADTWFYGVSSANYTLVWTITNQCGSTRDTVNISFADTSALTCGGILTDPRDNQQYPTVQIGTQCWMAQNLNVGTMVNGSSNQTNNSTIEKYCYNNDVNNCNTYGGLYQWDEAMGYTTTAGSQGICPPGWHIPTDAEWCMLTTFLDPTVNCNTWGWSGTDAGGKMKETGTTHWYSPNTGATNSSGFTALGAGFRHGGNFLNLRSNVYFWSSSEYSSTTGIYRGLSYDYAGVGRSYDYKTTGFSVRCLRDSIPPCTPQPDQANAWPDSLNIPDTSITLQANQPVNGTGVWSIFSGTGGSFADSSQYNTVFTGQVGNAYSLIWTITNQCGSTRDTVNLSFADTSAYTCGGILTDPRDNQQYPTVQIGTQCWMAKNLNVGTMVNGSSNQTNNSTIEKYCYNNDINNCNTYGGLYQWDEAMGYTTTAGTQGICPPGWHLPTDAEWCTLTTFLDPTVNCNAWGWSGTNAGGKMKATGFDHWYSPNTGATNSSGFTALGAGYRDANGNFNGLRYYASFWSSSEYSSTHGILRGLNYDLASVGRYYAYKARGFSVRCLRNN